MNHSGYLINFFSWLVLFLFSVATFSHGVIESPASREQFCGVESKPDEIFKEKMTHEKCRPIMTKGDGTMDNSVYNFMAVLTHTIGRSNKPLDQLPAHVCGFGSESWGGGKTPWDKAIDWPTNLLSSGSQKFIWNISWGNHFGDTEEFVYWITKPDFQYDPNKELSWNDFEPSPFCKLNYNDQTPNANPNVTPDKTNNRFITTCTVPARNNRAVIYGEWGRNSHTYERFHSCIDVVFSDENPIPAIKAVIKPLPSQVSGAAEVELDGTESEGANLSYSWSLNAQDLTAYQLTDSQNSKARLTISNVSAQQTVTVNLEVKQGDAASRTSIQFTHMPAVTATWKIVGTVTSTNTLNAGDKLQLRLIDSVGQDYLLPQNPLVLTEETAKAENWAFALAQVVNSGNQYSAKIGVLGSDNQSIEPVKSSTENKIYVPVQSEITNSFIKIEKQDNPVTTCQSLRKQGSNSYWLGYDVYADSTPIVLNFNETGIDLTKIIIEHGVFSNISVLDKDKLLINTKPDWVSKTIPGYLGFYGPNYGSYEPFNSTVSANCRIGPLFKQ
ncbi:lytic polysaccharide monooxygenase [Legionella hackeliae]|uniref:Chitin-binding protein n=1 Tax=Legionella hackeliae TaxID=449 RepID=A0A0A8UX82_LEGHA|nr:lytic polysaccharide monooxygenase [Legionella hackeliae]KTD15259.1 chitin-binding protein [Legionella hackeliae]CEK11374.1 exported protein of unknown function [Legionella hackeliae]STX48146.1 chitin-binding protein [Legionella hackeliae]